VNLPELLLMAERSYQSGRIPSPFGNLSILRIAEHFSMIGMSARIVVGNVGYRGTSDNMCSA
jgi:hypothetical protein